MKIVVVGGTGLIGKKLVKKLANGSNLLLRVVGFLRTFPDTSCPRRN